MYVKFSPNEYVLKFKNGKIVDEGTGLSFFVFGKNTSACKIPLSNGDCDFIFEEITQDYQTVSVQGQITYRIFDCKKVAEAMDFTVNLKTQAYNDIPIRKISKRIINIAEVLVKNSVGTACLTDIMNSAQSTAENILAQMQENEELSALGIKIMGFSILKITPNKETTRALESGTREEILKNADDALYTRRNASIEQERRVKENELMTEISVEEKQKQIKETEIATREMVIEREAKLEQIKTESFYARKQTEIDSQIELEKKRRELSELKLENAKKDADAEAYRIREIMKAYASVGSELIVALARLEMKPERAIAQAFETLAANSQNIGNLNITPDLLESLTQKSKE